MRIEDPIITSIKKKKKKGLNRKKVSSNPNLMILGLETKVLSLKMEPSQTTTTTGHLIERYKNSISFPLIYIYNFIFF